MQKYSQEKCNHSLIVSFPGILPRFSHADGDDNWSWLWHLVFSPLVWDIHKYIIGRALIFRQADECNTVARYSGMLTLQLF